MPTDPSITQAPTILPRPAAGYRRRVQLGHPLVGLADVLVTDAHWSRGSSQNWSNYALNPATGPKQRRFHSVGTDEISWSVGGDLTWESRTLVDLMFGSARGVNFTQVIMQQGYESFSFQNLNGFSLPWGSFTLNGNQNSNIGFTLEGKSTQVPAALTFDPQNTNLHMPVPSWYTGNQYVMSWSLQHSVSLTPRWANDTNQLPTYYRPGASEYTINLTTAVLLREYTVIKFGDGGIKFLQALVTNRNITTGNRTTPVTYSVTLGNSAFSDQASYQDTVDILLESPPDASLLTP